MKTTLKMGVAALLLFNTVVCGQSLDDLPKETQELIKKWEARDSWPKYAPGEIASQPGKLKPLRATYSRETGIGTDNQLKLTAVWEIDQVYWEGEPMTKILWSSSGDGVPRSSIGYVDPETSALRFRDVTSARRSTLLLVEDGKVTDTVAQADGSETKSKVFETASPLFDRYTLGLAVAAMEKLEEWQGFWLKGVYPGTKETTDYPILIGAMMRFADTSGKEHEIYPMMMPIGGGTLGYYYVSRKAPYFLGFEARNIQTQQVSMRVVLEQFQLLN